MKQQLTYRRRIISLVLCSYWLTLSSAHAASLSVLSSDAGGNEREFYASNKENRFLVKVHVLGDIQLTGIHHVPDNITLLDIISYAGGPVGGFGDASITLNRRAAAKEKPTEIRLDGETLVQKPELRDMLLHNGDVIHVESARSETFVKTLAVVSAVLGLISTSATLYLLTKR